MGTFITLLKREYWENKIGFQWVPVGVASLVVFTTLLTVIFLANDAIKISMGEQSPRDLIGLFEATANENIKSFAMTAWFYSNGMHLAAVMALVGYFYCLSALYDDRKDKSILFWKSLPISDSQTVLSKVVSVCLVLPIVIVVVGFVTNIAMMLIALLFSAISGADIAGMVFAPLSLLSATMYQLVASLLAVLWVFPFIGYLLFVSSATKKVPFLVSWLPLVIIFIVEGIVFKSKVLLGWIAEHFAGLGKAYVAPFKYMGGGSTEELFDNMNDSGWEVDGGWTSFSYQLTDAQLWIGMLIGVAFIVGATYIRRYRDEAL